MTQSKLQRKAAQRANVPKQGGFHNRRGAPRRYKRKFIPKGSQKHIKIKAKKTQAKEKVGKKALDKLARSMTFMVEPSAVGVQTTSLKSLYRMVHALVAYYYPKINVEAVANPTGSPQLGPAAFASWLVWAVITAARKNSSTVDGLPSTSTLPDFDLSWRIPNALALFITAWLRNKGKSYEFYNELPDMSTILTGPTNNNITFNATTYSLTASPYGAVVQPLDNTTPPNVTEIVFDTAGTTTFTLAQLIQAGDIINALISNVGGCVTFERIFYNDNGVTRVVPYHSPVLIANPVTDGFDGRMKFQEEVAAIVIDYSAPTTASNGIILKPYPMADQDRYVLGVVNLLSHCKSPCSSHLKDWKFPNDIRKILDPSRSSMRWHSMGRIKTLRVTATNNVSHWYALLKNICEQVCVAYSTTPLTNTLSLEANEMSMIMQAYVFSHLLDWGWQHYTAKGKLNTGQYLNSITSGAGPDFKALMMPQNIIEVVKQWRPVVISGQVLIPDCPTVAMSTLGNFLSFGTQTTYTGINVSLFQNAAIPNGYATAYTGLYSTNIFPSASFTAASYSLNGNTASAATFDGGITAAKQTPSLPIKLANLFIADWKAKFASRSDQKMFNMEYPVLGDVAMVSCTSMYQRTTWLFGSGWVSTRFDYLDGQTLVAPDRVLFWKGIQYARVNVVSTAVTGGADYLPFKLTVSSGDGGVLANVESFAKEDLGQEYNSLLTGMESNPKLTDRSAKPWLALDAIVSRLYDERAGAAFEEYRTKDALISYLLSLKEQGIHMANYTYSDTNSMFQPGSLSGWMSFLAGTTAAYNTGKFIFTDIWKTLNGLFGMKTITLI